MVAFRIETLTPEQLCGLNSTIWAHHHIIATWFVFVLYCSVNLLCVLVIVVYVWFVHQKLQAWLATCFRAPTFFRWETSYSLHAFSRQNQGTARILQTEPKYSPHSPDRTKVQPAFSRQNQSTARILQAEPKYSPHSPDRTKVQPALFTQELRYSSYFSESSQGTMCIYQTEAKSQVAYYSTCVHTAL